MIFSFNQFNELFSRTSTNDSINYDNVSSSSKTLGDFSIDEDFEIPEFGYGDLSDEEMESDLDEEVVISSLLSGLESISGKKQSLKDSYHTKKNNDDRNALSKDSNKVEAIKSSAEKKTLEVINKATSQLTAKNDGKKFDDGKKSNDDVKINDTTDDDDVNFDSDTEDLFSSDGEQADDKNKLSAVLGLRGC